MTPTPRWSERPAVMRELARRPRLWKFLGARFKPGAYLGLHLTIGLLVSVAAIWIFGGITEDVIHHDTLTVFDLSVLAWFHAHATAAGYRASVLASDIGSPVAMAVLAAIGGCVLLVRRRWLVLWAWIAAFGGGVLLDTVLKDIVQRPRPAGASAYLMRMSYSFPSGHAMGSLIGYGMLAYVLVVMWWRRPVARIVTVALGAVLVLLVGLSRLYLGVHYFSDVVGGYVAGVIWLTACISSVEVLRRKPASPVRPLPGSPRARSGGAAE